MVAEKSTKVAAKPVKKSVKTLTKEASKDKKATKSKMVTKAAKVSKDGKSDKPLKKNTKKQNPIEKLIARSKYAPVSTTVKPRTAFVANLSRTATTKDVRTMMRKYVHEIKEVRFLTRKLNGKAAKRNSEGKIIPVQLSAAFVKFSSNRILQQVLKRKFTFEGKPITLRIAEVKKAHVRKMTKQLSDKHVRVLQKNLRLKAKKKDMYENFMKNKKERSSGKKTVKEGEEKKDVAKVKKHVFTVKKTILQRKQKSLERRPLTGSKGARARVRMTRK